MPRGLARLFSRLCLLGIVITTIQLAGSLQLAAPLQIASPLQLGARFQFNSPDPLATRFQLDSVDPLATCFQLASVDPLSTCFQLASPIPLATLLQLVIPVQLAHASNDPAPADDSPALDASVRTEVLGALVTRLRAEYVDPEKGEAVADALGARERAHAYDGMGGESFADAVTLDMRDLCSDTHLGLLYSEEVIPLDAGDDAPESPEAQARRVEEWKHANFGFLHLERWPGNVGFLDLDTFADPQIAGATAAAAMQFLANTDALVIDLRYNHGGYGTMVAFLASYFLDGDPVHLNDYYWRSENRMKQSWTLPWVPGPRLPEQPLFLVTSARTHSAAEEFCYDLQTLGRARVVGERTRGGAHPIARYRLHDHFGAMIPIARAINPTTGTNWEGTGITPDVPVPADRALEEARILATQAAAARADDPELRGELEALVAKLRAEAADASNGSAAKAE